MQETGWILVYDELHPLTWEQYTKLIWNGIPQGVEIVKIPPNPIRKQTKNSPGEGEQL